MTTPESLPTRFSKMVKCCALSLHCTRTPSPPPSPIPGNVKTRRDSEKELLAKLVGVSPSSLFFPQRSRMTARRFAAFIDRGSLLPSGVFSRRCLTSASLTSSSIFLLKPSSTGSLPPSRFSPSTCVSPPAFGCARHGTASPFLDVSVSHSALDFFFFLSWDSDSEAFFPPAKH